MSTRVIVDPDAVSGSRHARGRRPPARRPRPMIVRLAEVLYATIYDAGGGADLAAVEAELGLPAGKGQQAFDLIAGARAALDDARIVALREIDQG